MLRRALLFVLAGAAAACGSSATTSVTATAPSTTRCQATLSASTANFGAAGGTGTLAVTVARECSWTATSQAAWIQLTAGTSGQGDGNVSFRVAANGDPIERRGALGVAEQTASVVQAAAPCRFDVTPPGDLPSSGGQATITVTTQDACAWTAASNAAWATLSPPSGKGPASLVATVTPNSGAERTAMVTIGLAQALLRQVAASAPAPAPTPAPAPQPPGANANANPDADPDTRPPPAPEPKEEEVKGRIDNLFGICPEVWFSVDGRLVHTTGGTDYKHGDSCRDLRDGRNVTVKGTSQVLFGRDYLLAESIDIKK